MGLSWGWAFATTCYSMVLTATAARLINSVVAWSPGTRVLILMILWAGWAGFVGGGVWRQS